MSFGVTPTGFNRKTLADSLAFFEAGWRAIFGNDVDLSPDSPDSQILGLFAGADDEAWQALADVYASYRPRQAVGAAQSDLYGMNGLTRKVGTRTEVSVTLHITTGAIALTDAFRAESSAGDLFEPKDPGIFIDLDVAVFQSVETDTILVPPADTWTIITPVFKLESITNAAAQSQAGSLTESDGELRARQILSTENGASNILESLRSSILQVPGVSRVRIYVNDTNGIVDGRPAHSYEAVVIGGSDADVANAIWQRHPAGIELFGSTPVVIVDSQGFNQTIKFTRPTAITIHVKVTVSATAEYPTTGDADMKQAIVDYANGVLVEGEEFGIGDDVLLTRLYTATNSVPGHNVTALLIDIVDPPLLGADIVIDEVGISQFLIANVDIVS